MQQTTLDTFILKPGLCPFSYIFLHPLLNCSQLFFNFLYLSMSNHPLFLLHLLAIPWEIFSCQMGFSFKQAVQQEITFWKLLCKSALVFMVSVVCVNA